MKAIVCELCGSNDIVKQDGLFVCQHCGTKYTLEEARKLMADATVTVQNAAQLDNLLNMAQSSFDSKNYPKAEEFCNQVIAMDDKNYKAWKLKGEAINYQITSTNQRILEVYNCIMTSYRVLDDAGKEEKKHEIIRSLKTCFEGEVDFWLKQFEANRPTDAALLRAKNAYTDSYNKMKAAFEELGFEETKEKYLINFDNFFVGKCNVICTSAWKTTVGYNYYRDYMGKGKDPFGRSESEQRWIIADTDLYRPLKNIWDTFMNETDNLIDLLRFAEEQFNDETNPNVMEAIFSNIAYFEECVAYSGSWKIIQGYTSNWDQYKSVGWHEEYNLTQSAKTTRLKIAKEYEDKEKSIPLKIAAKQRAKKEKERKEEIAKYWENHADEKERLEAEQEDLKKKISELEKKINSIDKENAPKIAELEKTRNQKTPAELEVAKQDDLIRDIERQRSNCGVFKTKEKKELTERLDNIERPRLEELRKKAETERNERQEYVNSKIRTLKDECKDLRNELFSLKKRDTEITQILNLEKQEDNGITNNNEKDESWEDKMRVYIASFNKGSIVTYGYLFDEVELVKEVPKDEVRLLLEKLADENIIRMEGELFEIL